MAKVRAFFDYFFDIKRGEITKSLLLQLYVFILITTLLIVKPTVNSIFLTELSSEALPTAYLLTALFAVIFFMGYNKLLNIISLKRIITGTLLCCIILLVCFSLILKKHPNYSNWLYIPYLFVAIYGLLTTSQFWLLANLVFNIREAKRIFGFIGSGAIAGGIFGGYLTSFLSNYIISEHLLLVAAGLLLLCVPINIYIWGNFVHSSKSDITKKNSIEKHPIPLIKKSDLLKYLTIAIAVGVIIAKLVDYQYSHFASEQITNTEELTSFFGFWFSTLSIVSLLFQLFLTKRVLNFFGVGKSLLLLPLGILSGSILLIIIPELWVLVFIKIIDGSLKQSVNKAATELLFIPIPIDIKKRTKVFIDVVIDSIATGIAGVILIFVIHGLEIDTVKISYFIIALVSLWVVLITKIRKNYLLEFKKLFLPPKHKTHHKIEHHIETSSDSAHKTIVTIFENGSDSQIEFMLNETLRNPDDYYFKSIKSLLNHSSSQIQKLALHNLYFLKGENINNLVANTVSKDEKDTELILEVYRYLIHKSKVLNIEDLKAIIETSNHKNRDALVIQALSEEFSNNRYLAEDFNLKNRINELLDLAHTSNDPEEVVVLYKSLFLSIGILKLTEFYKELKKAIYHDKKIIAIAAIEGIGLSKSLQFYDVLVGNLDNKVLRPHILEALKLFDSKILIPTLEASAKSLNISLSKAIFLPKVIENFHVYKSVTALTNLIEFAEYSISIKAIESLENLSNTYQDLDIDRSFIITNILYECDIYQNLIASIELQLKNNSVDNTQAFINSIEEARKGLIEILKHRLDTQLTRIFKLLGIRYIKDDIIPALNASLSPEDTIRTNALEYLENILDNDLKSAILPILDIAKVDNPFTTRTLNKLKIEPYNEFECYKILLSRYDLRINQAVLYLLEKLNSKRFIPLLESLPLKNHYSSQIQNEVLELIKKLKGLNS